MLQEINCSLALFLNNDFGASIKTSASMLISIEMSY